MIRCLVITLAFATNTVLAESPKLTAKRESLEPPKDVRPAIRELLESHATTVADEAGTVGTFWLRGAIPAADEKGVSTYRSIAPGSLIGVVRLDRPWTDFRHQEAPAGVYTLRIVIQPETKDHEGTAPHRDFCILCPAAEDMRPEVLPLKELVKKSGSATGGTHPVVMLLFPNPKPAEIPAIVNHGKRIAVEVKGSLKTGTKTADLGFAMTLIGKSTD